MEILIVFQKLDGKIIKYISTSNVENDCIYVIS